MLTEANVSAQSATVQRDAMIQKLRGAELRINELDRFRDINAGAARHLNQRVVDGDAHTAASQGESARLKRELSDDEATRRSPTGSHVYRVTSART